MPDTPHLHTRSAAHSALPLHAPNPVLPLCHAGGASLRGSVGSDTTGTSTSLDLSTPNMGSPIQPHQQYYSQPPSQLQAAAEPAPSSQDTASTALPGSPAWMAGTAPPATSASLPPSSHPLAVLVASLSAADTATADGSHSSALPFSTALGTSMLPWQQLQPIQEEPSTLPGSPAGSGTGTSNVSPASSSYLSASHSSRAAGTSGTSGPSGASSGFVAGGYGGAAGGRQQPSILQQQGMPMQQQRALQQQGQQGQQELPGMFSVEEIMRMVGGGGALDTPSSVGTSSTGSGSGTVGSGSGSSSAVTPGERRT
jgi:hypothetical protein